MSTTRNEKQKRRLISEMINSEYAPQERYQATNVKRCQFKLNCKTDADIIDWLERVDNLQGYIKRLIRNDMCNAKIMQNVNIENKP